jgi:hypothetical protein
MYISGIQGVSTLLHNKGKNVVNDPSNKNKSFSQPTKDASINSVERLYRHLEDRRPGPRKTGRDEYRPCFFHVRTDLGCG